VKIEGKTEYIEKEQMNITCSAPSADTAVHIKYGKQKYCFDLVFCWFGNSKGIYFKCLETYLCLHAVGKLLNLFED
jgi:hypothetical protein